MKYLQQYTNYEKSLMLSDNNRDLKNNMDDTLYKLTNPIYSKLHWKLHYKLGTRLITRIDDYLYYKL